MTSRLSFLAVLACCGLAAGPAGAAGTTGASTMFPTTSGTETAPSLGRFDILVAPAFWAPVTAACGGAVGVCSSLSPFAGYTTETFTETFSGTTYQFLQLTSPLLHDPSTTINVGAVGVQGSSDPVPGAAEVQTSVQNFNLSNGGTSVLAGPGAGVATPSPGQVTANSLGQGNLVQYSSSFFDIFVDINTPALPVPLFNTTPLLVQGFDLTSLPPTVVYTHTAATGFVPVYFNLGGPDIPFGELALAGHGVDYVCINPSDPSTCVTLPPGPPTDPPGDLQDFYQGEIDAFNAYNAGFPGLGIPLVTVLLAGGTGTICSDATPCTMDPFAQEEAIVANFLIPGPGNAGDPIPEPATWGIMLLGFAALGGVRNLSRRRVPPPA